MEIDYKEELKKYKYKFPVRVRNYQVDSIGIVHNAIYLEYCETARVEYIRELGFQLLPGNATGGGIKVMVKRNEINYYYPARFDDLIDVYARISYIKNTSFCFEHILINHDTGRFLSDQKAVHVNLNIKTERPERVPNEYREKIKKFEGENLEIIG